MTLSSPIDTKIKKIPSTHPQLPDIIPNPSISAQPISIDKTINDPFVTIDQVRLKYSIQTLISNFRT
jgi:hypothetical protein